MNYAIAIDALRRMDPLQIEQSYTQKHEKLARMLSDLGSAPNLVADYLLAQGCRGERNSAERCPVAVYLQRQTGEAARAFSLVASLPTPSGFDVFTYLPAPVVAFIDLFDQGWYPDLDAGCAR